MKLSFTIFFVLIFANSFSQDTTKFRYFIGYGLYDGVNIGAEYHLKNKKQISSASFGYERLFNLNQQTFVIGLGYHNAIFTQRKNKIDQYKWQINNRITLWQLEDKFYLWRLVSFTPSISRKFVIFKKHNLLFDFGPIFNIVLYNKRKTFEEIGWPHKVMPNFRIIFIL